MSRQSHRQHRRGFLKTPASAGTVFAGKTSPVPATFQPATYIAGLAVELLLVVALLLISGSWLAGATYNPFIYFRF
jgi:hypothetical protein